MSSDVLSEELSVHEGAGYDETFGSGDESEDFSPLSKRETITCYSVDLASVTLSSVTSYSISLQAFLQRIF